MKKIKPFNQYITESEVLEFDHFGNKFTVKHIHTNVYRVIENTTRTWGIVRGKDEQDALDNAMKLVDEVFPKNIGNILQYLHPSPGKSNKFIVTGKYFDSDKNITKNTNGLSFRAGTHWKNPVGTDTIYAKPGDIITFSHEGEDNGFWYLDGNKKLNPKSTFLYSDGSTRSLVKGGKPWSLIWSKQIKPVK